MTWKHWLAAALAPLLAIPANAQDEIFAITEPVQLDATGEIEQVGELIYAGGVAINPGEAKIGGISGLEWHEDRLYAVSDDGRWLTIQPDEIDGRLIDLLTVTVADLGDERGRRLRGKEEADAEAITRSPDGSWLVAFERNHRIWRYEDLSGSATLPADPAFDVSNFELGDNSGIETMAVGGGSRIVCPEMLIEGGAAFCEAKIGERVHIGGVEPPAELIEHGGAPTDAACASDGTCYVLFRSYRPGEGNRAAIMALSADGEQRTLQH